MIEYHPQIIEKEAGLPRLTFTLLALVSIRLLGGKPDSQKIPPVAPYHQLNGV